MKKYRKSQILVIILIIFHFLFSISSASANEPINISADNLEYDSKTNIYIAKGSVRIDYTDSILNADEIHFNNATADAVAIGSAYYEDSEVIIRADRIELNLNTKAGTIYNSNIFYKQDNYHIQGGDIKRFDENNYSMNHADATTCDATPPEWRFTGEDIKIELRDHIEARNTTLYIKNIPVLYSPYFWAPLFKKRQTGFLTPTLGYSNTKGITFKQGFFWAIKDNMDSTLYADYYSLKGFGKGLDYRYILNSETNGEFWMYHLRDNELLRDFFELKSYHNQKLPYDMSGYLKMHIVNEFDYYNVLKSTSYERFGLSKWESDPFGLVSDERLQKYLESNLHISKPFTGGRIYLLGQYRQSLEDSSGEIPQSLPEIGLIINTIDTGMASFNVAATGTNFWRDEGQYGQRLDIYPNVYLSTGRTVNFTQKIGLRETLYFLENPSENLNREIFELRSVLTTRFFKNYSSFIHLIEPSIEYVYVPSVDQSNIPVFDSIDSMPETSDIIYSFTNRLAGSILGSSEARLRLSQSYSLLDVEKPFSPILIETALSSNKLNFRGNAFFDVYDKRITETIASVDFRGEKGFVGIGKNFRRSTSLDQYTIEAGINSPIEILGASLPLSLYGKLWYDLKGNGVQESTLKTTYSSQCWGLTASYTEKPNEYQIMLAFELKGLGSIKLGKAEESAQ